MGLLTDVLTGGISKGLKGAVGGAKDWAQGTNAYKAGQAVRQSKVNPWYSAKDQPGSKGEGDTEPKQGTVSGSQSA